MKRLVFSLLAVCCVLPAHAQIIAPAPTEAPFAANGLEGLWSGYLLCGGSRGYAIFYDIVFENGTLVSTKSYFDYATGDRLVEIIECGPGSYVFDARPSDAKDYDIRREAGFLVGEARGHSGNDACALRLARFPAPA